MIRLFFLVLLPLALLVPKAFAQSAPMLKPVVTVAGDLVTLGDLIAGAGTKAEIAVFRAPDLGQTGIVPADDIIAVAAAHGLVDVETSGIGKVAVKHASRIVTADEMLPLLSQALADGAALEGPDALAIEIDPAFANIHVPVEADGAIRFADAFWTENQGRFDATLIVRRIDGTDERRQLTGKAVETAAMITAARALERGTVLTSNDLRIERKPKAAVRDGQIDDAMLVVGMEVRRALREGQAIRTGDLSEPVLVKSGATVSVVLKTGGLTLTAIGQAMSDGKNGAAIQVMNTQSKRVLQAVVTGPDQVLVQAPRTIVSAQK
ncbi:flagellar basal body P-ring formation chaperone FlgA [Terrihabitans soli]|nr:flagellar basal body P-ring formation chaperone FlgA [Terrihabitans soli]